jgi:flagellar biosynthetic protein FlhB
VADDLGEKTEEATPKRRQEAREEGQVARSQDLGGALLLIVGTLAVAALAFWMLGQARLAIAAVLDAGVVADPIDPDGAWKTIVYVGNAAIRIGAPVLLIAWGASYLAHFTQVGWLFSPKAVAPKTSKLNPINGFRRVFGLSGLVKAILDALKVLIVAVVAVLTVQQHIHSIAVMPYLSLMECLATAGSLLLDLALRVLVVLLFLGVIDYAYQRWRHNQDLKMTKQQVKDEMKQTEGDPDVKRRRMRMQQQIAMQRLSVAVPKADVVVTNPEHIAVAIRYAAEEMNAPKVVAKGADYLALRIRQLAMQHGIPVIERKPLARALYRQVAVGQEIPPDFYAAVAEVLAYVYRLSGKMAG